MKTNIKLALLLLTMAVGPIQGQIHPTMPSSPTASSLGKYVENVVSHHTGIPEISIPIHEIKLKDLTIPISLSYNPQDIQVETVPSNVGLGWSLQAGGVITRAVKDIPDDSRRDYCNTSEEFDQSIEGTPLSSFSFCKWGYLYSISDSEPFNTNGHGYFGTSTYNLDLDAIYSNRATVSPEKAIIGNFGYSLWDAAVSFPVEDDDENEQALVYKFPRETTKRMLATITVNTIATYADKEPDIFYFNFPGFTGKFVFDVENGTPKIKTIPYQDLKFTYVTDPTTGRLISFTAVDNLGNQYFFQDVEYTICIDEQDLGLRRQTYNSSWWLTKISCPNGEFLNFNYSDETFREVHETLVADNLTLREIYSGQVPLSYLNRESKGQLVINQTKRIAVISNDNIDIQFSAAHPREDLRPRSTSSAITSIEVRLKPSPDKIVRVKEVRLEHDYFLTDDENLRTLPDGTEPYNANKRLRLRSVQEFGNNSSSSVPKYSFEYNYYDFNSNDLKKFPNRYSDNQDLWGYSNGANNSVSIPALHIYPDHYQKGDLRMFSVYPKSAFSGRHFITLGADKMPNKDYQDIGVLTKITYPTGGNTSYEFEPHSFLIDGEEYIGGGVRIKKIIKSDNQNKMTIFNYQYTKSKNSNVSAGKIITLPMFAALPFSTLLTNPETLATIPSGEELIIEENILKELSSFYSYPITELGRTSGSNVGYTNVIEYMTRSEGTEMTNGFIEYQFSFPGAFGEVDDILNSGCSLEENGFCDGLYKTTRVHNFFMNGDSRDLANLEYYPETSLSFLTPPNPNYDWNRGLLIRKSIYNSLSEKKSEETYTYTTYFPNGNSTPGKVYGIKMSEFDVYTTFVSGNHGGYPTRDYSFRVAKYEILTDVAKVLASKTIHSYSQGSSLNALSEVTSYEYGGAKHMNVTKIAKVNSDRKELITRFKYPFDYDSDGPSTAPGEGVYALRTKNISAIPLETSTFLKKDGIEHLLKANLTVYNLVDGKPSPTRAFQVETNQLPTDFVPSSLNVLGQFQKDARYVEKLHLRKYGPKGNLLEVDNKTTGIITSYIWGYDSQYIIAKVENSTYQNIETQIGTATMGRLEKGYYAIPSGSGVSYHVLLDSQIRDWLNPLRTSLPAAQSSIFTYDPLGRLSSETNINGRTTHFEYDYMNRLKHLKDHENNIIKKYEYHFIE